jgi:hypothetical protein
MEDSPKALIPQVKIYAKGGDILFVPTVQEKFRQYAGVAVTAKPLFRSTLDSSVQEHPGFFPSVHRQQLLPGLPTMQVGRRRHR